MLKVPIIFCLFSTIYVLLLFIKDALSNKSRKYQISNHRANSVPIITYQKLLINIQVSITIYNFLMYFLLLTSIHCIFDNFSFKEKQIYLYFFFNIF